MIQVLIALAMFFVYPFTSKYVSSIVLLIIILLSIIGCFILRGEYSILNFVIVNAVLISIGMVIRYFHQNAKIKKEHEDLRRQYENKSK